MVLACVAGVGGGNFASSMANINAFYPQRLKGWALGLNAGGGNIGVPAVQLVGLRGARDRRRRAPPPGAGGLPAADRAGRARAPTWTTSRGAATTGAPCATSARTAHTWIMSLLYIGTFGSFIGFGFAFGQVLQVQFGRLRHPGRRGLPDVPRPAARLAHPADRRAARRPVGRGAGDVLELRRRWRSAPALVLYAVAGALVPAVPGRVPRPVRLLRHRQRLDVQDDPGDLPGQGRPRPEATRPRAAGPAAAGALIGIAGAVGALGGVLVNLAFRQSFLAYEHRRRRLHRLPRLVRALLRRSPGSSTCVRAGSSSACDAGKLDRHAADAPF